MIDTYKLRHADQRMYKDADQTEFTAILRGSALMDSGLFDDKISGAIDEYDLESTNNPSWQVQDLNLDSAGGAIREEIERRSELLGDDYPFIISRNQLLYSQSQSNFYEFCLAISMAKNLTTEKNVYLPRVFERISASLLKIYFGCNSFSIHVGKPRDPGIGTTFITAMERVHRETKEWIWQPQQPLPGNPQTSGDEGMDFIVWKDSPDKRLGKLFIIGQCACGDDWKNKFNDLSLPKLSKWFNPVSYVTPVKAFTTPHHLSDMNLVLAQIEAGWVFDRARLSIIAERFVEEKDISVYIPQLKELSAMVIS